MTGLLWVCLGSALGGGARYLVVQAAAALLGPQFPFGTLAVNLVGSYLMGICMYAGLAGPALPPTLRLFLTTGVLGGFTTYSAFNYEALELVRAGTWPLALLYMGSTVLLALAAGALGLATARSWFAA